LLSLIAVPSNFTQPSLYVGQRLILWVSPLLLPSERHQ
jgi:hypothetical protein